MIDIETFKALIQNPPDSLKLLCDQYRQTSNALQQKLGLVSQLEASLEVERGEALKMEGACRALSDAIAVAYAEESNEPV